MFRAVVKHRAFYLCVIPHPRDLRQNRKSVFAADCGVLGIAKNAGFPRPKKTSLYLEKPIDRIKGAG
jgi:hypothetical protein